MQTAHAEVRRLLDQIRVISANPTIQRCSDEIEVLCAAYMEPDQSTAGRDLGLTGNRAIIFDLLHKRTGQVVSREALHNACTRSADCDADIKTLDVQVCKLRKGLAGTVYEDRLESIWGVGYRLNKPMDHPKPRPHAKRTHCPLGHPYDAANTFTQLDKDGNAHRRCRKCRTKSSIAARAKRNAVLKVVAREPTEQSKAAYPQGDWI